MTVNKLLRILILIAVCMVLVCLVTTIVLLATDPLPSAVPGNETTEQAEETNTSKESETVKETESNTVTTSVLLEPTADMGLAYQDKLFFFGESTTAHLKSRGVLSGGNHTNQVWHPASNTLQIQNALNTKLRYLGGQKTEDTLANIVKKLQPEYLVLCFGLNGVEKFSSGETGKRLFLSSYQALIDTILENSPNTRIILQSIYPVARGCTDFKSDAATINAYLTEINRWTMELAKENGLRFADAATAVTDESGFLSPQYDTGDGVHITADGYKQVLAYFRTHAYVD